jgi:hypothetical protein
VTFCHRCPLPLEAIREDERALEVELVMESACANGIDPLAAAVVHLMGRHLLTGPEYVALAFARLRLRLKRGADLYDRMPAKLRHAA